MYSQDMLILAVVIAVFIGLLIGLLISKTLLSPSGRAERRDRDAARKQLEHYRNEVSDHFQEAAERLRELSKQQREVQEHLAKGAIKLIAPEESRSLIKQMQADPAQPESELEALEGPATVDHSELDQPRDYAPKKAGETGTLSEEYGLKETDETLITRPGV